MDNTLFTFISSKNKALKDVHLVARLQTEFDTFILRASYYIYKSRCVGTWQYLVVLPFYNITIDTLWKLYYFLTNGFKEESIDDVDEGILFWTYPFIHI